MAHSIQNKLYNEFQSLKAEATSAIGFLGNHKVAAIVTGIGVGAAFTTGCSLFGKGIPLSLAVIVTTTVGSSYILSGDNRTLPKQIFQHATNDKECFAAGLKQGAKEAIVMIPIIAAILAISAGRAILS